MDDSHTRKWTGAASGVAGVPAEAGEGSLKRASFSFEKDAGKSIVGLIWQGMYPG